MRRRFTAQADCKALEAAEALNWLKEHGMEDAFEEDREESDWDKSAVYEQGGMRKPIPDASVTDAPWRDDDAHANCRCSDHASGDCDCDGVGTPVAGKCTYCGACLPCPILIDIPTVHRLYDFVMEQGGEPSDNLLAGYFSLDATAGDCTCCGECELRCPNDIPITARMAQAAETFGE